MSEESQNFQYCLIRIFPQLSVASNVFRPICVRKNGTLYQTNYTYLITGFDGLDPQFLFLNELLVIGSDEIVVVVFICDVLYFDSQNHAYVIEVTSQQILGQSMIYLIFMFIILVNYLMV